MQKNPHFNSDILIQILKLAFQVLVTFLTWTASSSGVEQLFSRLRRSPTELASSKGDTDRRLAVVMGGGWEVAEMEAIRCRARALYAELLPSGKCRSSDRQRRRLDCGRRFDGNTGKSHGSEAQWLRERKNAVHEAVANASSLTTPPRRPLVELPDSAQKEKNRQNGVELKRKAEALSSGLLLDKEVSRDVELAAEKRRKTDEANDKARVQTCQALLETVRLRMKKENLQWALKNLSAPVYFVGGSNNEIARWQRKLATAGVNSTTQDPMHTIILKKVSHSDFHNTLIPNVSFNFTSYMA